MSLPHAIVFDLDGTLIDSEHRWDEVRRGLAAADGIPWPIGATPAMMGMNTQAWSAYLADVVGLKGSAKDAERRTIDGVAEAYADGRITILPGAVASVRRMAEIAPVAIASSSSRRLISLGITLLGLDDLIRVRVSTEEVAHGKPAPDGYLEACRQLGVDPAMCVAVEDSTNGVLSALAAGMKLVAIPPHFQPPSADVLARAHAVIPHLDELTPNLVHGLFTHTV